MFLQLPRLVPADVEVIVLVSAGNIEILLFHNVLYYKTLLHFNH